VRTKALAWKDVAPKNQQDQEKLSSNKGGVMESLAGFADLCKRGYDSVDDFLHGFLEDLRIDMHSDIAFVSLVDLDESQAWLRFRQRRVRGGTPGTWLYGEKLYLPIGDKDMLPRERRSISGFVAQIRRPYRTGNVQADDYYLSIDDLVHSEVAVPILTGETLLGVLNVESYQEDFYTPDHERLLLQVATLIAPRLKQLLEQEDSQRLLAPFLRDIIAQLMRPDATSYTVLSDVLAKVTALTRAESGLVRIVDGQSLVLKATYPPVLQWLPKDAVFLPIGGEALPRAQRSFSGTVAATRKVLRTGNVHDTPGYRGLNPTAQSALGAPIRFGEALLGVITLLSPEPHQFSPVHEEFLSTVAQLIAAPLSGLLTREHFPISLATVRQEIRQRLTPVAGSGEDVLTSPERLNTIAHHTATVLSSALCTIWLANPAGTTLTRYGAFGIAATACGSGHGADAAARACKAVQDAFGPFSTSPGQPCEASPKALAWQAMSNGSVVNYGPNRDAQFFERGFAGPFLLAPLLTTGNQPLGIIHVSLKQPAPGNLRGVYSEAEEQTLKAIQGEITDILARQQARNATTYAASDLHDALSFVTAGMIYKIDEARQALRQRAPTQHMEEMLQDLEHATKTCIREIRTIIGDLKAHTLEDQGLVGSLREYLATVKRLHGLQVDLHTTGVGPLPINVAWQLYRIAQEAIANIDKHADVKWAQCDLEVGDSAVLLRITDKGKGYDSDGEPRSKGYGLTNMRERATRLGTQLKLQSTPGQGTTVTVEVRIPETHVIQ
jgi:putative methionine-R-sulfoxide reductase with GAF domain/two-component sensor histidine kinase